MSFLYAFLNFFQPGVFWPALVPYKPILVASAVAGASGLLRGGKHLDELRRRYFTHPAFLWLCAFTAIQVISVYYSGVASMLDELNFWDVYVVFVVTSLLIIHDEGSLRRYVWGMMSGSAVVIAYGIYAVAAHLPILAGGRAGAYGMYENHNDYTFIIVQVLPFAYLFLRLYRAWLVKLLLIALLTASVAGVILSLSRGGILTLVLECLLIAVLTAKGKRRVLTILVLAWIGLAGIGYQFAAREANQQGSYTSEDAKESRYELWRAARNMIVAHPVLGVGSRRFHEFSQDYAEISHDNRGKVAHNTYIEIAADTGALGLLTFLFMLWELVRASRGARLSQTAQHGLPEIRVATLISLCAIMFRSLLDAKAHDWSFYLLAVLAIASTTLLSRETQEQDRSASASKPVRSATASMRPMVYRRQ
jgi:O-antigen ligase